MLAGRLALERELVGPELLDHFFETLAAEVLDTHQLIARVSGDHAECGDATILKTVHCAGREFDSMNRVTRRYICVAPKTGNVDPMEPAPAQNLSIPKGGVVREDQRLLRSRDLTTCSEVTFLSRLLPRNEDDRPELTTEGENERPDGDLHLRLRAALLDVVQETLAPQIRFEVLADRCERHIRIPFNSRTVVPGLIISLFRKKSMLDTL